MEIVRLKTVLFHGSRVIAILILGQTLYFKFSGSEESKFIFSVMGMEPWGRYGLAVLESFCILFLLIPRLVWFGALLGFNLMLGAVLSHFVFLGIVVKDDGGFLFVLALVVLTLSIYLLYMERKKIPYLSEYFV
ncbi:DoxX family protein [Leptospira congkakensis]|uniref:DoxX family protein n=1 Tax=Leptospira congkakensis TaxID=2484932 RepID=A0A4Z1ABY2_9LEPT|nr:DoxX family protein [Leptospira congkakensis]TGL91144.1 DoxX family protein [Leptospira congkakensis]TGL98195.1 DoxX family protein [Leptospira congkakensis]